MKIILTLIVVGLLTPTKTFDIPTHCLLPVPTVVAAQEGNPGHKEPAPGWSCAQGAKVPADHACSCHRECKDEQNIDENGEAIQGQHTVVKEDAKRKSYCYQKHCNCPLHNCD